MDHNGHRPPVPKHVRPEGFTPDAPEEQTDGLRGEGVIEGRNAVLEALRAGRPIDKVYLSGGDQDKALRHIAGLARDSGAVVVECDRRKLDNMSFTHAHQGVIAVGSVQAYRTLADILDIAKERGEAPLIIICDGISDPHNLGAIIRTAEAAGAHGVVIPKRRSAGLTAIVEKTSAGAASHMAVARVANLTAAIGELKDAGLWVFGAVADAPDGLWSTDFSGPVALVIGSEGDGISRLVARECDGLLAIPMRGKTPSLNASVSAGILIYEVMRQRTVSNEVNR